MISWSIEAAKRSKCFDHVIVSTDDDEIAELAQKLGAEVPFRRPQSISDDITPTVPVVAHALNAAHELYGVEIEAACCIYATAPFILERDIAEGLRRLEANAATSYVLAATSYGYPIQRALRRMGDGAVEMMWPENIVARSQDLEEAWHDAGQFYWARARTWSEEIPMFQSRVTVVEIPRFRSQDIDTEEDWVQAELMFEAIGRRQT